MSTKLLEEYLELADEVSRMKALAARYQAASKKDAAIVVNLNLVIESVAIPASETAALQRAVAGRVRTTLASIVNAAIAEREAALATLKARAKAEYDRIFGP